jgi:hypothetical protein
VTLPARCDGTNQHSLSNLIVRHTHTELTNEPYGLVPDCQAWLDGVLPLQDVQIRAANYRKNVGLVTGGKESYKSRTATTMPGSSVSRV